MNLAEGTDLLFQAAGGGAFKSFTIMAGGAGFEIEVQVKKNSSIEAQNFTIMIVGAEEAEAQFEENFCLRLHGNLHISMNTGTDEGGDVQFKKVDPLTVACGLPNINVDRNITLSVGGGDSEIQIEEDNHLKAGGDISLMGNGLGSQVQTKKNVTLEAGTDATDDITLTAPDGGGEAQVEENNKFDAGGDIEIFSDSKTEIKKSTDLDAGDEIDVELTVFVKSRLLSSASGLLVLVVSIRMPAN